MFTDSKQVFEAVTKGRKPTEKRIAIDMLAARGAYCHFDIREIGLIWGDQNQVDSLSKLIGIVMLQYLIAPRIEDTYVLK